jgi:hypothetical protein
MRRGGYDSGVATVAAAVCPSLVRDRWENSVPPTSALAAPADTVDANDTAMEPPHGAAFIDRAQRMVEFLAQCDERGGMHADQALVEWISSWRSMRSGFDATQHFVAEELGIIVRALNGPAESARLRDQRTDHLSWRIARCITAKT